MCAYCRPYVLAADTGTALRLYDTRRWAAPVLEFDGYRNSHKRLGLALDPTGEFVFAGVAPPSGAHGAASTMPPPAVALGPGYTSRFTPPEAGGHLHVCVSCWRLDTGRRIAETVVPAAPASEPGSLGVVLRATDRIANGAGAALPVRSVGADFSVLYATATEVGRLVDWACQPGTADKPLVDLTP